MKLHLLFVVALITTMSYGQEEIKFDALPENITLNTIYNRINTVMYNEMNKLCVADTAKGTEKDGSYSAVTSNAFLKQSKILFNTVVVGNQDAVNSGSAFSYSHDKDKHKFSANMTFAGKKWDWTLIDVGTSISDGDGSYKYYSDGKWGDNISFKLGINLRYHTTQYFMDTTCVNVQSLRQVAVAEKLAELKEAVELGITSDSLKKRIDKFTSDNLVLNKTLDPSFKTKLDKMQKQLKILKKLEFIADPTKTEETVRERRMVQNLFKKFNIKLLAASESEEIITGKIIKYVDDVLTKFDEKNNPFHGYSISWFNFHVRATNSSFKITGDEALDETIQEKYSSKMKSSFESSWNYNMIGLNVIQFFKIYTSLNQVSFLDSPNLIGKDLFVKPDADAVTYYNVVDENDNIIDSYSNIRDWKYSMDIGTNYTNFFMFDKTLGLTGRAALNFAAFHNVGMEYDKNYSLLGGAVFRMVSESKFSAATFTLIGGVENQLFDENGWSRFILKASIGVPFSIFEKKK